MRNFAPLPLEAHEDSKKVNCLLRVVQRRARYPALTINLNPAFTIWRVYVSYVWTCRSWHCCLIARGDDARAGLRANGVHDSGSMLEQAV